MKRSFFKKWVRLPLTDQEWKEIKRYQRVPVHEKLAIMDRMRSFMFDIWHENPATYRQYKKTKNLKFEN